MKLHSIWWTALTSLLAVAVYAQAPPKAAQSDSAAKPALPAGHPDIGTAQGIKSNNPALPAGHPEVPGAGKTGGADPSLPAGHPDISGATAKGPLATHGTLVVRAYQGTKNGPAVGEDAVAVECYHQGKVIRKLDAKLDKTGTVVLEKLPLALPFQPLVKVIHAGVEYAAGGNIMDGRRAGQQIELAVYETTADAPAWRVQMRHVIVEPAPDGVKVVEMLAIENPADRSWLGALQPDGKRVAFSLALPAGAERLEFAGTSNEAYNKTPDGKLTSSSPLLPGVVQLQLSYVVPVKDGKARFSIVAPTDIKHMMVFVTDNGTLIKAEGLQASGTHDMGKTKALIYGANDLKAGQEAVLTLTLPANGRSTAGTPVSEAGSDTPKVIAGVGGGLVLAVGTGYVLLKSPRPARAI